MCDVISHNKISEEYGGLKEMAFEQAIELIHSKKEANFYRLGIDKCLTANDSLVNYAIPNLELALDKQNTIIRNGKAEIRFQKFKQIIFVVTLVPAAGLLGYFLGKYIP